MQPFHLAFPVDDLAATRAFFVDVLGASVGRESDKWVDFNFFGHQVTAHLNPRRTVQAATNPVDGKDVPTFHFGVVLDWPDWEALGNRLRKHGVTFVIEPYVRFKGEVGEQGTFFVREPSGAALEFKTFKDMGRLFARAS
jgi:extradiol dioxygenase family protein